MFTIEQVDALAQIVAAQQVMRRKPLRGWAALNSIFRAGEAPLQPLDGTYAGRFVALRIFPVLTQLAGRIASAWMPWKGKGFDGEHNTGDNLLARDSYWLARLVWPFYRGYNHVRPWTYHAFAFDTSFAPGIRDHDLRVFRLSYNVPGNPRLFVRRIVDELVQVDDGIFLGKAYFHWGWGRWKLWAYFLLTRWDS